MTHPDLDVRRIREAFDRDLSGYRAPSDFPERVRHGGLRRARRRRVRRLTGVGAVACAAGVAVAATAPWAAAPPKSRTIHAAAPQRLPSAASVGKAMLTGFDAASGDILYSTQVDTNRGQLVDTYQDWNWPAQPVPTQPARWRERVADQTVLFSGEPVSPLEDYTVSYLSPSQQATYVPGRMTMVCYAGKRSSGCGFGDTEVRAGTWAEFGLQVPAFAVASGVGAGGMFSPATLAQGIAKGQWRVLRRTRLDGQPDIVLSETRKGTIEPMPFLLWVSARTGLPVKYASGSGGSTSSGVFVYLRPTPANMALFRVNITHGYPRSAPVKG
jgi:hypothetical protein